ncbi:MAG: hypothetical protein U0V74_08310 [Chitinophagales bacterium]
MKSYSILLLFILSALLLTSCNNSSSQPPVEQTVDTTEGILALWDTVSVAEPIEYNRVDYFSNIFTQDSFSLEVPAGEILNGNMYFRIYNEGRLLYIDTIPTSVYLKHVSRYKVQTKAEDFVYALEEGMDHFFHEENFTQAAANQTLSSASPDEIQNMQAWDEAHDNSREIVFTYPKGAEAYGLITYSNRQKKVVLVVLHATKESS